MPIPRSLEDKLRGRLVIPFVGAGVSMGVLDRRSAAPVFPSWRQLLLGASDRLEQETKRDEAGVIRSLLNTQRPDYFYAATRARTALGAVWYDFLKETLDVPFAHIDERSLDLAKSIWRLGSNLIITTNYDQVMKWACPEQQDVQSWNIEVAVEQAYLLQKPLQRPVVWHLHGSISNTSDLILSPDGYQLLYPQNDGDKLNVKYQAALETLRNQLVSKSFLFIGFSLDDEYFGLQLKIVHEIYKGAIGPHYAVVREDQAERVRELKIEPVIVADFQESLRAVMAEFEAAVGSDPVRNSKPHIPDYGPHRPVFYVPFKQKGDEIVGQQQVLEDVHKQLTEGKRTAIGQTAAFRGLGGLGKTQLAIEYAYRYRDQYPNGVIWLTADQNIDAQLIEIAERARWIAPESEHKYKIQIAQQRIRSYSDCLIIFDNLEDRVAIAPYLPEPEASPHILVTSRIDHADFYPVPLELLDDNLSLELLVKEARREPGTKEEDAAAWRIVGLLGGLPLALELAGAYLGHRRTITFRQYEELLNEDLKRALPKNVSSFTEHEADLYSTLCLSEGLLGEEEHLRDVLDLLTWSGSAPMSTDLISHLLGVPNVGLLTGALALGTELRLLQQSKEQDSYSLHRLVGEVRRTEIPLAERLGWVDSVCGRIGNWFQEKKEDFSHLTRFEAQVDHLKKWQENAARFAPSHSSRLMWLQAYPAYHRGGYVEARNYVIEAQKIFEELGDTSLELKANLLNDLAFTNSSLGDTKVVLANHLEALRIRRDIFDDPHPEIAASLSALGNWYGGQGDLHRALEYSQEALAMRYALFGERHVDIATALNNVAHWYEERGDLQRALEISEQALLMLRELFGERHPHLASSLSTVGSCYGKQGNLQRALEYFQQALVMRRELFGEQHPHIANSISLIGRCYGELGDLQRDLEYSEQALAMRRNLFGEPHQDIATSLQNVGASYGEKGDVQLAIQYSQQALAMRRALFGEPHPSIANSLQNLGNWYGEQGDLQSAVQYSKQALAMRRELFGEKHPDIANSLHNVGVYSGRQGNTQLALEYSVDALAMHRQLFGEVHPSVASSLQNVGAWCGDQGDIQRALEYSKQALSIRRQLFGDVHADTANSLQNLSALYGRDGNLHRALDYSGQALGIYRTLFQDRHPATIEAARQHALDLMQLNRRKEAYDLVRRFVVLAQGRAREQLTQLEEQLLSNLPGFRKTPKTGKRKGKKKRR